MSRSNTTSIETYCGLYLNYLDPQPEQIELADIARGLAQTCRFAGQTTRFYSVAEHAIYVASMVPPELALAALHHDSHEAYLTDWPTPLKEAIGAEAFDDIADGIDWAIAKKFGFATGAFGKVAVIKDADLKALRHEAATLKFSHGTGPHWGFDESFVPLAGIGWEADEAERKFLKAHRRYSGGTA